jgi:hypothetical protein
MPRRPLFTYLALRWNACKKKAVLAAEKSFAREQLLRRISHQESEVNEGVGTGARKKGETTNRATNARWQIDLAVGLNQTPAGDENLRAWRHFAELAGDLDLFALGGLAETLLETSDLLAALLPSLEFRFALAKSQGKLSAIRGPLVRQLTGIPL